MKPLRVAEFLLAPWGAIENTPLFRSAGKRAQPTEIAPQIDIRKHQSGRKNAPSLLSSLLPGKAPIKTSRHRKQTTA
jgi:hypothetical protein